MQRLLLIRLLTLKSFQIQFLGNHLYRGHPGDIQPDKPFPVDSFCPADLPLRAVSEKDTGLISWLHGYLGPQLCRCQHPTDLLDSAGKSPCLCLILFIILCLLQLPADLLVCLLKLPHLTDQTAQLFFRGSIRLLLFRGSQFIQCIQPFLRLRP